MPQTREHLDICGLLGIPRGVVALTKSRPRRRRDCASWRVADVRRDACRAPFSRTRRSCPVSAQDAARGWTRSARRSPTVCARRRASDPGGPGAAADRSRVLDEGLRHRRHRHAVGRAACSAGDDLVALPALPGGARGQGARRAGARRRRRRGARRQSHRGQPGHRARSSSRAAQVLVRPGELEAGRLVDVRLRYLATSQARRSSGARACSCTPARRRRWRRCRCSTPASSSPGQSGLAQLHARRADGAPARRSLHPARLRAAAASRHHRRRRRRPAHARRAPAPRHARDAGARCATTSARCRPTTSRRACGSRWRAPARRASRARRCRCACRIAPRAVDAALAQAVGARALVRFDKERGAVVGAAALASLEAARRRRRRRLPRRAAARRRACRARSCAPRCRRRQAACTSSSSRWRPTARSWPIAIPCACRRTIRRADQARAGLAPLAERTLALYAKAALQPPRPVEAAVALAVDRRRARAASIELLVRGGSLVRMKDLVFHAPAVDALRDKLVAHLKAHAQITPQEWKELVGASRKFTIPLAEHFDAREADDARRRGAKAARPSRTGSARRAPMNMASRKPISQ